MLKGEQVQMYLFNNLFGLTHGKFLSEVPKGTGFIWGRVATL
jgi:hypothetical protein